jgi:LssY-like putative type I secretion system component LssY
MISAAAFSFLLSLTRLGPSVEIPAGTEVHARLTTAIPWHAKPGLAVSAVLVEPMAAEGVALLPPGTVLRGRVEGTGDYPPDHRRSCLKVDFGELDLPSGSALPIETRLVDVDNARETVDEEGRIVGMPWVPVRPGGLDALLLVAAHAHPISLVAFEAAKLAVHEAGRAPIAYATGTDLTLEILNRPRVPPCVASGPARLPTDDDLIGLVPLLPDRAEAAKFRKPSDLTNLLVAGSRDSVRQAFFAAGWTEARPLGFRTGARALVALATRRGYRPAPVSLLRLDGVAPDLVFEKQNNTVARRHHVRLWRLPESSTHGPIWLGAATHDVGITFDRRHRTFTHRIDSNVDHEREKVASDLAFTGRVQAWDLVGRPDVPLDTENATGDRIETDGRLAVLVLSERRDRR